MSGKPQPIDTEAVIAWIKQKSTEDGIGPSRVMYDKTRPAGLPGAATLQRHGYTWRRLLLAAGVEMRQLGRPPIGDGATFLRAYPGMIPPTVEAEIQHMHDHAEPARPASWPLFGIPTRCETFIGRCPDGTTVRCTRQYISLR